MSYLAALLWLLASAGGTDAASIQGNWINAKGSVVVRIAPCGSALCGQVVCASLAAKENAAQAGTVPLVGVQVLYDLVAAGERRWRGRLFVPDLRRSSAVRVIRRTDDVVEVVGCDLGGLLCRSQLWSRAPSPSEDDCRLP